MQNLSILAQIAFLIVLAPIFARLTRIPISIIEITIGAIAVWVGYIDGDNNTLKIIAKIGFLYLMFLAGLEIDIQKFITIRGRFFKNIIIFFTVLYALSFLIYLLFDLNPVYIIAIPIVSLGMIMVLVNEYGKDEKWIELTLNIGIVGEFLSIIALVIYDASVVYGVGEELYKNLFTLIIIFMCFYLIFRVVDFLIWWFPRFKKVIMPENDYIGQDIRVSMALFFVLIGVMQYYSIDMALGAFVAGVFIANFFKFKVGLHHKLNAVGFGFLIPLFFVYVGTTVDVKNLFKAEIIVRAFLIMFAMIFVRLVGSFVAYYKYLGFRDSILFSLGYSMPLTFVIAIATMAHSTYAIGLYEYYAFILAAVMESMIILIVIKIILNSQKTLKQTP